MKEHLESSGLSNHLSLLMKSHMTVQKQHTVLQIEHTTLNEVCTSLQEECITLEADHQQLLEDHTTLKSVCASIQGQYSALQREHQIIQQELTTLQSKTTSLMKTCAALEKEKSTLLANHATLQDMCMTLQEDSSIASHAQQMTPQQVVRQPFQATRDDISREAIPLAGGGKADGVRVDSTHLAVETAEQKLGNTFYIWLLSPPGQEEGHGYHDITLNGSTKFRLEWEPDELFLDPGAGDLLLTLYLLSSDVTNPCRVNVHVASSSGYSGQLASVCCGKPQTPWGDLEGKPLNASKMLVGSLALQCNWSEYLKVSLQHHQAKMCRCSCHHTKN
jgi:predicted nuclease with TOPRIM domain